MYDSNIVKQNLGEETETDLNELVNYELLVLVNVLLHSSYQFVLLRSVSDCLAMHGISWMTEKTDEKCRDSAVKIMNWIHQNNGYLELADIKKPTFNESQLDGEFFFARWNDVEKWIEEQVVYAKWKIHHSHYEKKTEVIMMIERLLSHILSIN